MSMENYIKRGAAYVTLGLMGLGVIGCGSDLPGNMVYVNAPYVTAEGDTTTRKLQGEYDKDGQLLYLLIENPTNNKDNQLIPGDKVGNTLEKAIKETLDRVNPK